MAKDGKTVILVADDEPSMLAIVASHLRAKGYMVLEASDGDQAWELAHEHLPDLVVLDVMMPGMSGWEVCRKIREAVSLAHTGVVMLTGIGENLNEMTSPLYGADGYVDKPFEFPQLDKRIQEALERRRAGAVGRLDGSEVEVAAEEADATVDDGWSDPGTMPGVGRTEEKPARAKKPKEPKAKPAPVAKSEAKPKKKAEAKPKKKAEAKPKPAAKKPAAKAKAAPKKPAKAAKKPAKAPAKKAPKAAPVKAKPKAKAAKSKAKPKAPKPAAKAKAKKTAKLAKPAPKKASVSKLSAPAMKSAARTAKKSAGKKKK